VGWETLRWSTPSGWWPDQKLIVIKYPYLSKCNENVNCI
jgi:hypothetical protein